MVMTAMISFMAVARMILSEETRVTILFPVDPETIDYRGGVVTTIFFSMRH